MQIDFTKQQTDAEKVALLRPYEKLYVMLVVVCGSYMLKHSGRLSGFDKDGSVLALDCLKERFYVVYSDRDFERNGRMPGDQRNRWQYIPVKLIDKLIEVEKISTFTHC